MSLAQTILPEFDQEMKGVRRALERVPDDRLGWKPHPKSMTLGRLASHLAELPTWAVHSLKLDSLDIAPPGQPTPRGASLGSRQEILALFDAKVAEARAAIAEAPDEAFGQPWSLLRGGQTIFTLPRLAVLRSAVLNHMIHHRGQLTVFLRLNDVPVPSLYGPSADEPTF
jgi:uncharacterized damage-inducible protein DinB